jgi:hypothetical protein
MSAATQAAATTKGVAIVERVASRRYASANAIV